MPSKCHPVSVYNVDTARSNSVLDLPGINTVVDFLAERMRFSTLRILCFCLGSHCHGPSLFSINFTRRHETSTPIVVRFSEPIFGQDGKTPIDVVHVAVRHSFTTTPRYIRMTGVDSSCTAPPAPDVDLHHEKSLIRISLPYAQSFLMLSPSRGPRSRRR